jgi:hypothetical protein
MRTTNANGCVKGISGQINYLPRSTNGKLKLIQADADTFAEVLGLVSEYEGSLPCFFYPPPLFSPWTMLAYSRTA